MGFVAIEAPSHNRQLYWEIEDLTLVDQRIVVLIPCSAAAALLFAMGLCLEKRVVLVLVVVAAHRTISQSY